MSLSVDPCESAVCDDVDPPPRVRECALLMDRRLLLPLTLPSSPVAQSSSSSSSSSSDASSEEYNSDRVGTTEGFALWLATILPSCALVGAPSALPSAADDVAEMDEDDSDEGISPDRESAASAAKVRNFVDARTALMAVCVMWKSACQCRAISACLSATHFPPLPIILPQTNGDVVRCLGILFMIHEPSVLKRLIGRDPLGRVHSETELDKVLGLGRDVLPIPVVEFNLSSLRLCCQFGWVVGAKGCVST